MLQESAGQAHGETIRKGFSSRIPKFCWESKNFFSSHLPKEKIVACKIKYLNYFYETIPIKILISHLKKIDLKESFLAVPATTDWFLHSAFLISESFYTPLSSTPTAQTQWVSLCRNGMHIYWTVRWGSPSHEFQIPASSWHSECPTSLIFDNELHMSLTSVKQNQN